MAQNKMTNIQNLLIEEMERLADIDMEQDDPEKISKEIHRGKTMASLATAAINNVGNAIKVKKIQVEHHNDLPNMDVDLIEEKDQAQRT